MAGSGPAPLPEVPSAAVEGDHQKGPPALMLFDTRTKKTEVFRPLVEGKVGMYVCGVTPYDFSHVGHARAYVSFDVLYRYLKFLGYEVEYVRNFTDIDDKIIRRANEAGETASSLSNRFINEFLHDIVELQCLPPTREPRVTQHIKQIIDLITKIMEEDKAYTIEGEGVYFSIDNFPEYLSLSGRKLEDNLPGSRVAVDPRKRNPFDFALWKSAKEGEPFWESPWGHGRPGWHIECSAMSKQYLGPVFDIHGGGRDLIFPHHENELAQSRAAYPESEVKCWMHNGYVMNNGKKMAKADKNFFTIRDIIARYHPMALRLFLMRTHYRSDMNHSDTALEFASGRVYYIYQALQECEEVISLYRGDKLDVPVPACDQKVVDDSHENFLKHMSNDLHTTAALDELMKPVRAINSNLSDLKKLLQKLEQQKKAQSGKKQQQPKQPEKKEQQQKKNQAEEKQQGQYVQALVALHGEVTSKLSLLGLMPSSSSLAEVLKELKQKALKRAQMTEEELQQVIEQRRVARKNKDFAESDRIRRELSARGIALMDEPTETLWKPAEPELVEEPLASLTLQAG
ncbi:cysteine--tRNA ligase CPS1, chloroplastic/mitochondrial isoform X1 [Lolium perenne]|uniref:cysteine--tRNA ligase CPS1, chloroplastic/mitochondrial isoform X1 n=1 Tax=Lolium perenne TaxID=4522 RepID=UPI0021F5D7F9|nr:cysteine--tRNA ligase CPS1, chloroplastic/mitochondrial-like isoform X1 [Lolium perenne]